MTSRQVDSSTALNGLVAFRQAAYECLTAQPDALFELCDALLLSPHVSSFIEVTLCPAFRRRWPSAYPALKLGKVDYERLGRLLLDVVPPAERPICGIDHTCWLRPYARTVRDRAYHHSPTLAPGGKPVGIGHGYSTVSLIPEQGGSWALPLSNRRIPSWMTPLQMAIRQARNLVKRIAKRVLFLADSEYGCAPFVKASATINADFLLRIRPNRVLWGTPPPYGGMGRPREYGPKFSLKDPASWTLPDEQVVIDDLKMGNVIVRCWNQMCLKNAPDQKGTLIRVHRPEAKNTKRDLQDLWLFFVGQDPPPLSEAWKTYLRRFAVDHFYRFAKQTLLWNAPKLREPEAGQTWTDLLTIAYWQLWLARPILQDCPLPWQKPQQTLTPGRALRAMGGVLSRIGTPAQAPKPRGKSPGRAKGQSPGRYRRYPVIKKSA